MGFEDFIQDVLNYYNQIAPQQSTQYNMMLSPSVHEIIIQKIIETLHKEEKALSIQMQKETSKDPKIIEGVKKLSLEMINQAKKENRTEIRPEDFQSALVALNWRIWPFCSSSSENMSLGAGL